MVKTLLDRSPKAYAENQTENGIYEFMLKYKNENKLDGAINSGANCYRRHAETSSSRSAYPTRAEAIKSDKRVTIHMNFPEKHLAKLIILPESLEELLKIAGKQFLKGKIITIDSLKEEFEH